MKKFLKLIILTISILIVSVPVFASSYTGKIISPNPNAYASSATGVSTNSIKVQLNGDYLDFTDELGNKVDPKIINSRTMVPMRKIFEVFGASIEWDGNTRSIKATTSDLEIGLQIDNTLATVKNKKGEVKEITLDTPPTIVDNRTLVPVRFIAESLDKKVGWDSDNRSVIIIDSSIVEKTVQAKAPNFYKYLNSDIVKLTSAEMDISLNGSLKHEDASGMVSGTKIDFIGGIDFKYNDAFMAADIALNLSGAGDIYEYLKMQNMDNIKINYIFDINNSAMYISSPLLVGYEGKWLKYDVVGEDAKTIKNAFANIKSQNTTGIKGFEDALVPSESLTIESYEELEATLELMSIIFSNENFKASGSNYKLNFDLVKLLDTLYSGTYSKQNPIPVKLNMDMDMTISDKVVKDSKCNIAVEFNEGTNKVAIEAKANVILEKYNQTVTINVPNAQNVVEGTL